MTAQAHPTNASGSGAIDALTGLPRRFEALARLEQMAGTRLTVVVVGLDKFRLINDATGHDVGDEVLRETSHRITEIAGEEALIGRFGSDEFVVALEHPEDVDLGGFLASELRSAISRPMAIGGMELTVTACVGVAESNDLSEAPLTVLQSADTALTHAKRQGPDSVVTFDKALRSVVEGRLEAEQLLRWALDHDGLRAYFQPIMDANSLKMIGVEALVRIDHPERGLIPPGVFVPVAEENGLIVDIDTWMLEQSCRWGQHWYREFGSATPYVSCNVSGPLLGRGELASMVRRLRRAFEIPAYLLCLEMTETTLIQASPAIWDMLAKLRATGVHVGLDDFGTGFSSMTYLCDFPVSFLKIDRSFVSGMGQRHGATEVVQATVGLSHALGMKVTAEGVESMQEVAQLRALGCDRLQGYLFSTPVQPEVISDVLRRSSKLGEAADHGAGSPFAPA